MGDRILRLAHSGKCAVAFSGEAVPSDDALIRAAMAVDLLVRVGAIELVVADLAVVLTAATYDDAANPPNKAKRDLLAAGLPDPWDNVRDAVEGNRKLLGLSANDSDDEVPHG